MFKTCYEYLDFTACHASESGSLRQDDAERFDLALDREEQADPVFIDADSAETPAQRRFREFNEYGADTAESRLKVESRAAYLASQPFPSGRPWTDKDHARFKEASDRWDSLYELAERERRHQDREDWRETL